MTLYRVVWEIDIDAESPRDAAAQALKIQRDTNSHAIVFDVVEPDGGALVRVDLYEDLCGEEHCEHDELTLAGECCTCGEQIERAMTTRPTTDPREAQVWNEERYRK